MTSEIGKLNNEKIAHCDVKEDNFIFDIDKWKVAAIDFDDMVKFNERRKVCTRGNITSKNPHKYAYSRTD